MLGDLDGPWAKYEREKLEEEGRKREREREREEEGGLTGCREAVEILTRNPKKASYDVNKDGVKVAVLTFTKSAYRLGETVLGVLELNDRTSRARVVQYSAILEAHESLPSSLAPQASSKHLRRIHAEHHSSFSLSTLRTTFSLDIPSDASPAFQVRVGGNYAGAPVTSPGGLEWKVRLCLLVAVASDKSSKGTEGVRVKGINRDGERGEWGSSWCATDGIAPQEKSDEELLQRQRLLQQQEQQRQELRQQQQQQQQQQHGRSQSWAAFFAASFLGGSTEREYHDGDEDIYEDGGDLENPGSPFEKGARRPGQTKEHEEEDGGYDGIKPDLGGGVGVGVDFSGGEEGWNDVKLETVECEVPIKVWPGNTAFKAVDVVFEV
ncbi:Rgp1-domain-containing protein [Pluteus cervinus]|uniref:Rgp1-domain-containing protein n=1 Tax=Pluteus cervinus TaxID=181527 RepID=A0ACD3B1D2_9AGAR|nr:Rgp1-domain-containing protein [Pluteus cervinus]